MLPIQVDQTFTHAWQTRTNSNGYVSVSNGVLRTVGATEPDSGIMDFYFPIQPGQNIEVMVWVKDNGSAIKPRVAIDAFSTFTDFNLLDYVEVDQNGEWGLYTLKTTVPFTTVHTYARLVLGKWVGMGGIDCYYKNPIVKIDNGIGANQSVAKAVIRMANGTPSFHPDFRRYGIKSMSYSSSNKMLSVICDHRIPSNVARAFPTALVCSTGDHPLIPTVGWVVQQSDGLKFGIRWSNGNSLVDISNVPELFVFFKVEI
jgi:hypothetical protein